MVNLILIVLLDDIIKVISIPLKAVIQQALVHSSVASDPRPAFRDNNAGTKQFTGKFIRNVL